MADVTRPARKRPFPTADASAESATELPPAEAAPETPTEGAQAVKAQPKAAKKAAPQAEPKTGGSTPPRRGTVTPAKKTTAKAATPAAATEAAKPTVTEVDGSPVKIVDVPGEGQRYVFDLVDAGITKNYAKFKVPEELEAAKTAMGTLYFPHGTTWVRIAFGAGEP